VWTTVVIDENRGHALCGRAMENKTDVFSSSEKYKICVIFISYVYFVLQGQATPSSSQNSQCTATEKFLQWAAKVLRAVKVLHTAI
jgi:type IV secretory pathway VirB6-like protein